MAWIHWRRARWLGKALRGEKGDAVLNTTHWGFQHQERGDVFLRPPPGHENIIPCPVQLRSRRPGLIGLLQRYQTEKVGPA